MPRLVPNRRQLIKSAAAGLASLSMPAIAQTRTVKVGLLLTFSGPFASTGDLGDKAVRLYEKLHGEPVPGVKLEILRRDETGANPDTAKRLAQELIVRDKVNMLMGVQWTPNAAAIAPLCTEAKVPLILSNAAGANLTRLSPYIARVSFTIWQVGYPMGLWAAKNGYKRAYTAVADFAPGHDGEQGFIKGFKEGGGEIIGSVRMPLQNPDFVPFLLRIKDAKPDCLFVFSPGGPQATAFVKGFSNLQLKDAGIQLMGTGDLVSEEELPNMGDAVIGTLSAAQYSAAAKRPENDAFISEWKKAYPSDSLPNTFAIGAWDATAAVYHAIKNQPGGIDADKTMALLKGWTSASPRGPIMIDPVERDIVQNVYIRRTEKVGSGYVSTEFETVPMVKDPWKEANPAK